MSETTTETDAPFVHVEDGVLRITIATEHNGSSLDVERGIRPGASALRGLDPSVGAVLVTGAGPNFCAGGDVRAFASAPERGTLLYALATDLHEFVRALRDAPVPVVAGVHGWAAGAGMSLACAADIAIAGPSTKLQPAYPALALTPDGGLSWLLPRIVGIAKAREIVLGNHVIGGDEAVRLGVVSRLVGDDIVRDEALRVARTLAAGPRSAYAATKTLFAASAGNTLSEQLDLERDAIAAAADSPAGREGVDAFVEKRRPQFTDR